MSDPMEDEELLAVVQMALFAGLADCAPFDAISEAAVRAILNAGYRIVKPVACFGDDARFEIHDTSAGMMFEICATSGPRARAAAKILGKTQEFHLQCEEIFEMVPVYVSRAELESMKEAGE